MKHCQRLLSRLATTACLLATSGLSIAQASFWSTPRNTRTDAPTTEVTEFRAFQVDVASLESWLSEVPTGKAFEASRSSWILELPMPDGEMERFSVLNSPVMAPALAARYPEIQVFAGQGVDSPEATVRFDMTPQGFHAMILKEGETVYIDPYHPGIRDEVIVYTRTAFYRTTSKQGRGLHGAGGASKHFTQNGAHGWFWKGSQGHGAPRNRHQPCRQRLATENLPTGVGVHGGIRPIPRRNGVQVSWRR